MPINSTDKQTLVSLVNKDSGLHPDEKQMLIQKLETPEVYNQLVNGPAGAAIGFAVSKFLGLSKQSQVLLSIAGFGIGNYLKSHMSSEENKKFFNYDKKMDTYKMNYEHS